MVLTPLLHAMFPVTAYELVLVSTNMKKECPRLNFVYSILYDLENCLLYFHYYHNYDRKHCLIIVLKMLFSWKTMELLSSVTYYNKIKLSE